MTNPEQIFSLANKRALITGGSRGIGGAIASAFAQAGAEVVVNSRSATACEDKAKSIGGMALPFDVLDRHAVDAAWEKLEPHGVDILVTAAGLAHAAPAESTSFEDLTHMWQLHVAGAISLAQKSAKGMAQRGGGSILFVSSIWGLGAQRGSLAYGSAKAALIHAAKVMAIEWAPTNVRVNALAPGFVDTKMTSGLGENIREKFVKRIPLGRIASPEEMVGPALLACSEAGSYMTGEVLVVDGGGRAR